MTNFRINYNTNFYGNGKSNGRVDEVNSAIISRGVLDLSGFISGATDDEAGVSIFSTPKTLAVVGSDGVSDASEFFAAFSIAGRSFSYLRGTLTLRFSDDNGSHSIVIAGFTAAAAAGFRIKTADGAADFLVSQLARSLAPQVISAIGGAGSALEGGSGADLLIGGVGADTLDGGLGFDTAGYGGSKVAISYDVTAAATNGFLAVVSGSGSASVTDKIKSVERIVGTKQGDTFTLSATDGVRGTFDSGLGADRFVVKFDDTAATTNGYFGDILVGGGGVDTLALEGTNNNGALVVNLAQSTMSINVGGVTSTQRIVGFENVDLSGGYTGTQAFTFIGSSGSNVLTFSNVRYRQG